MLLGCLRPALKKRKRSSFEDGGEDVPYGTPGGGAATPSAAAGGVSGGPPFSSPFSSGKKTVTFPKGKSCEVAVGSADPDVDRTPIELPFTCDGCGNYILTSRHNCGGCEDFDLCEWCFRKYEVADPEAPQHDHPASAFIVVPSAEAEELKAAIAQALAEKAAREADKAAEAGAGRDADVDADESERKAVVASGAGPAAGVNGTNEGEGEGALGDEKNTKGEQAPPKAGGVVDSHPLSPASFHR